jgi:hypothetical protein
MARSKTYSDEYLKAYCNNEGTTRAVEKLDAELIENPRTRAVFEAAQLAQEEYDQALANLDKHLGL